MRAVLISLFLICIALFSSGQENYLIGFSQCTMVDDWRETMVKQMRIELGIRPGLEMVMRDAGDDSQKQIEDIRELMEMDIDLLIVSPNESEPLTPVVSEVYNQGIPVIVIDRKIKGDDYTLYIGADNYQVGQEAGHYTARLLNGKGRILEIWGLYGSSPAQERHKGFLDALEKYPGISISYSETGEWLWQEGKRVMKNHIERGADFDLVFAHNDFMAHGAYLAAEELGKENNYYIVGIDGLLGSDNGIQHVLDGQQDATVLYPTGGYEAIEMASGILNGEDYPKEIILSTILIDSTNARIFKMQNQNVMSLQEKIQKSRVILDKQIQRYNSQRTLFTISLVLLSLIIILIVLLFRSYRLKMKANRSLTKKKNEIEKQNTAIKSQQEQLLRMNKELEHATQMKLRFFTNISHEFRTPLTLMIGPLEQLMSSEKFSPKVQNRFSMMHRNAMRMLRLINQLMDFRKLESDKLKMYAEKGDLKVFIQEIKENFDELAIQKNIDFYFNDNIHPIRVYFDKDMLDKILFNILSNAFKHTSSGGRITINLTEGEYNFEGADNNGVAIEISDSGVGMSQEHINNIFERFYQIDKQEKEKTFPGAGIGLALTKGLVKLHKGHIEIESEKGKGTLVRIILRKGKQHFSENDLSDDETGKNKYAHLLPEEGLQFTPTFDESEKHEEPGRMFSFKPKVLVVEDNPDVQGFIRDSLGENYDIILASNGKEGLKSIADNNPDLVISDIMMPEMDGLEMTKIIKSDINTSHIPVILLTALASIEKKLDGIETGADSYIPKPFNSRHLAVRVRKLIENRIQIRKYYQENMELGQQENSVNQLDKKFLDSVKELINKNITESNLSVEFLGKELGLSRVHLYRKLKHLTGMTASEFIKVYKLKRAARLLTESGVNITEVAYQTGFSTPSYFTKCFKEHFHVTPSQYLQNYKY